MHRTFLALIAIGLLAAAPAVAGGVPVHGRVVDQFGLALPGVSLALGRAGGGTVQTALTGGDGTFSFDVPAGDYRLEAQLDGFDPIFLDVHSREPVTLPDLVMSLGHFSQETTVVAVAPTGTEVQPRQFGAPATIATQVIENAPLRSSHYDDMLPLLPNVVRGPDGLISVAGARAPSGAVLLNGLPSSEIASGDPIAAVPLGAVETVQVVTTGFAAEFGPSTGGVTIINSRSGSDVYKFIINSFTPRPRLADGGAKGVEAWTPNLSFRGPIVRGRAWFAQSIDYHYEKTRVDTVSGTQDRKQHRITSFTQADVKTNQGHMLTAWVNGQKEHVDGERLGAFTPLGSVPDLERGLWSAAAIDRAAFASSTLEVRFDVRHNKVSLAPAGAEPYVVAHSLTRGAYFDTTERHALSYEAAVVYSRAAADRFGHHLFRAGATAGRRQMDGLEQASCVTYLRSDGSPARRVEFVGDGNLDAASTQVGTFAQDGWELNDRLTLNLGARFDHDSRGGTFAAPRAGLTWGVGNRMTVTAGAGWFAGDRPLAALAFGGYQSRRITTFDESGAPSPPVTYRNVVAVRLERPRARIWSVRVDRRLGNEWQLRTAFQERRGSHEATVSPVTIRGQQVALLSTNGESRIRSFEATLGYRPTGRSRQFYLSYVRAAGKGNTNDFGQVEGLFREARLDGPEFAPLPASVPHRVMAWGVFSLPAQITVAPFLDLRSGFAYSAVNDDWSYAERRYSRRYPFFASLDLVVNKVVRLAGGIRVRAGVKLYNIAGRRNGRDVQACADSADFGQTYNALGRQVRGVFEIIWGDKR